MPVLTNEIMKGNDSETETETVIENDNFRIVAVDSGIKEIFDNNGNLILDKFLMGISSFIEEFQKNYAQSNSYQNKEVDNYNYNWIELLNIFEIGYK